MRINSQSTLDFVLLAGGLCAVSAGLLLGRTTLTAAGAVALLAALLRGVNWLVRQQTRHRVGRGSLLPETSASQHSPATLGGEGQTADLVEEMMARGRYALLLRPQISKILSPAQLQRAVQTLDEQMSVVPAGAVQMGGSGTARTSERTGPAAGELVAVEAVYLDRFAVTNRQFQEFVSSGGYEQMALWDSNVWPAVLDFVDATGQSGPRFWQHGTFLPGTDNLPVVGVSWYEATAFARWAGKRLPSDAEWVKAGSWPVEVGGGPPQQRRFPWGDSFDPQRANLWSAQPLVLAPVHEFASGASVGGIHQLIGNVWEWMCSPYLRWSGIPQGMAESCALQSLRGGSFNTYFDSQATCQFQSGDHPLARRDNIGFRCALSLCDVAPALTDEPYADEATAALPDAETDADADALELTCAEVCE